MQMEIRKHLNPLLLFCLGLCFIQCFVKVKAADEKENPTGNVNLAPYQQWISASECMTDYPGPGTCSQKNKLTMSGVLDVASEEVEDYCKPGACGDQIKKVLNCIHNIKRDFWFANKASVQVLRDAISDGCRTSSKISTADYQSSGVKMYHGLVTAMVLALSSLVFLVI